MPPLGIQIEEPFGILPLEALCDTSIEGVVMDMRDSYDSGKFDPSDKPSLNLAGNPLDPVVVSSPLAAAPPAPAPPASPEDGIPPFSFRRKA